jgi:hypothetical protein
LKRVADAFAMLPPILQKISDAENECCCCLKRCEDAIRTVLLGPLDEEGNTRLRRLLHELLCVSAERSGNLSVALDNVADQIATLTMTVRLIDQRGYGEGRVE